MSVEAVIIFQPIVLSQIPKDPITTLCWAFCPALLYRYVTTWMQDKAYILYEFPKEAIILQLNPWLYTMEMGFS
jgi:hypothetical protein